MISGEKHPLILLLGAVIAGWISLLVMDAMVNMSKLKTDTAIGAVLSVFFGLGILLLTAIQHSGDANQAGLDRFLFGKAASMTSEDVLIFGSVALLLLVVTALLFRPFTYVAFDRDFARTAGLPVRLIEFVLATITVLAVAVGIQAVGVVLMAALLITPAAAARFWTNRLPRMVLLAAIFGMAAGYFGAGVSYLAPSMPTGPWIVMLLSAIAVFSVVLAPEQGIWARLRLQRANARKMLAENILKAFFKLESHRHPGRPLTFGQLQAVRGFRREELRRGLRRLQQAGLVTAAGSSQWQLTPAGINQSRRVVRLHRLWELYLNRRLQQAPDHVHNSAEAIEHILTPEVEAALLAELGHPIMDPHESPIPYDKNGHN
jgi:manganese/zinc/iron transport system permease protein